MLNRQTISLQNKISDSGKLSDFLTEYAKTFEISDEIYHDLRLVIEEAFVNIASYAYAKEDHQTVTIELSHTSNEISITFTDTGIAFNPLTDPAESKCTDDQCEGGMGIHLIKSLTDQQKYNRIKQRNVFTVTKHYTK
ncbi:MAG: ATP-binding protein [Gammaproteobacteria bacterium]|nr:ATP-binding protein [Gammaproteobacteria bacterium]